MTVYIALLRAINVGGHAPVSMAHLRACIDDAGLEGAQTLLQTGNVVFRSPTRSTTTLERELESALASGLDLKTDVMVRSATEWQDIVAGIPFPAEAKRDPGHVVVMLLKGAPKAGAVKALQAASKGPEVTRAGGKHLYISYPDGIGRSKLTMKLMESHLGTRGTGRNWNTVLKLDARLP